MQIGSLAPIEAMPSGRLTAADRLEQAFLEEMLKYCGPQSLQGGFSGGAGEEQFASFLTREQAAILARKLDLGFGGMIPEAAR